MGAGTALRVGFGVAWSLALAGCLRLPKSPAPSRPAPQLRASGDSTDSSDLRIPATALARRGQEIPVVPVPPIPQGRDLDRRSTVPPAQPIAPPAAPPVVATSPTEASPTPARHSARDLVRLAAQRYAGMDSYIVRLTRREQVNGKNAPEEVILFKFRKEPWSLHFKWLSSAGQGREVIYVKGQYENKIHTLLAAGDAPLMPAGKRISLAVDSPFVRSASRHPITEAGIGASLDRLNALLDAQDQGDRRRGVLTVTEPQNRVEYPRPVEAIEHVIPPGAEPELPRGGRRLYCFDPETNLPLLVTTRNDRGQEVEYYRYDRLQTPVHLDADDFNPDKVWAPRPTRPAGSR